MVSLLEHLVEPLNLELKVADRDHKGLHHNDIRTKDKIDI
jgi:hypothetical protein